MRVQTFESLFSCKMLDRRVASFLLLANLCSTALSAIPWNEGDGRKVSWSLDCEFWSSTDIESLAIAPEVCGLECYNNAQCTHFTHKNGHCFLRKIEISSVSDGIPAKSPGSMCGFVRSRVPQPFPTSYDFTSDTHCLCRPKGTLSNVQTLKTNDGAIVHLKWSSQGEISQGGQVTWADFCDFPFYDLPDGGFSSQSADKCASLCLQRSDCTNFAFNKFSQKCWLKNIPSSIIPSPLVGWMQNICGYVKSRYDPEFLKSGLGTPNWQCICRPL